MDVKRRSKSSRKRKRHENATFSFANSSFLKKARVDKNTYPQQIGVKSVDTSGSSSVLSVTSTFDILNPLKVGTDRYQRIGRSVLLKSLHFTFYVFPLENVVPSSIYDYNNSSRILIVYDRQPATGGSPPVIADILKSYQADGSVSSDVTRSYPNPDNLNRFLILVDWKLNSPGYNVTSTTTGVKSIVFNTMDPLASNCYLDGYLKLDNLESIFDVTGNLITGSLLLVTTADASSINPPYSLTWTCRLRYIDL